jgi:hypothetical protein
VVPDNILRLTSNCERQAAELRLDIMTKREAPAARAASNSARLPSPVGRSASWMLGAAMRLQEARWGSVATVDDRLNVYGVSNGRAKLVLLVLNQVP